jgi:hypothetical protein
MCVWGVLGEKSCVVGKSVLTVYEYLDFLGMHTKNTSKSNSRRKKSGF